MSNSEDDRIVSSICTAIKGIIIMYKILQKFTLQTDFKNKIIDNINLVTSNLKRQRRLYSKHFDYAISLLDRNNNRFLAEGDKQSAVKLESSNECYTCTGTTDTNCICYSDTNDTNNTTIVQCMPKTGPDPNCPQTVFIIQN
jgi:hypothetical protein